MEEVGSIGSAMSSFNPEYEGLLEQFQGLSIFSEKSSNGTESMEINSINNSKDENSFLGQISKDEVFKDDLSSSPKSTKKSSSSPPRRTSLWKLFDPLHSENKTKQTVNDSYNDATVDKAENIKFHCEDYDTDTCNEQFNKIILNAPGTVKLISFESPRKLVKPLIPENLLPSSSESFKKYTEAEFHQALKTQESRFREEFSKKYTKCETSFTEQDLKLELKLSSLFKLNKAYNTISSEFMLVLENTLKNNEENETRLEVLALEKEMLKEHLKTSKDDVSDFETAFSDFHKRYEQCKSMIKTYKENEEHLMKNIESTQVSIDEQNSKNGMLQLRIQEVLDKSKIEIESNKKLSGTQVTVLEAQLKKTKSKICSLESDLDKIRLENDKFGNIYDDLMSKITY